MFGQSGKAVILCLTAVMFFAIPCDSIAKKQRPVAEVEVVETSDATFAEDVLKSPRPVLVDFYATWCGPCRFMTPILERVAKKYKKDLKVVRLDIDKNPRISEQMNITGVPMFVIYKNGKPVETAVGAMPKDQLTAMVQRNVQL
jgi:thioredoxin 1